MRLRGILFVLIAICILPSCGQQHAVVRQPAKSKLGDSATHVLLGVVADYYQLKNALVATNAPKAGAAAQTLATAAVSFEPLLAGDTVLKPYVDTVIMQSRQVAATDDHTCERQRIAFGSLSAAIYTLLKSANVTNAGVYHQFCPMAFNNKGAYWLSNQSEIENPYFGKKMLECGEVKDSL